MRVPRITIRFMIVIVAGVAIVLWLAVNALRERDDPDRQWLYHHWEGKTPGESEGRAHIAPFWPRYGRRLLGRDWPGNYDCPCDGWQARQGVAVSVAGESRDLQKARRLAGLPRNREGRVLVLKAFRQALEAKTAESR